MREWPVAARVALLAASACVLFVAMAEASTSASPYAPNDWAFSHVALAKQALRTGHVPMNDLWLRGTFSSSHAAFLHATGLDLMTFYASTMWLFWNGLPLHPTLLATLAAGTGLSPEQAIRLPLGGVALVLLSYASAALALGRAPRADARFALVAPFLLAVGCAPFLLDMRVLMPSTTLVMVGLLLHALLRRMLLRDPMALAVGIAPLALLPFWYYTVSYFVLALLAGFLVADVALRWRLGRARPALVPWWAALAAGAVLLAALLANGALASHLQLAEQTSGNVLAPDSGSDYATHLNRQPWRSALLYAEVAVVFAPLIVVGLAAARRAMARQPLARREAVLAHWGVGGAMFSVALLGAVGVSFLNRSVIYFAPLACVAAALWLSRLRPSRWRAPAIAAGCAALLVASGALVATATPRYTEGDAQAYRWVGSHVAPRAVVYAPLEVGSVLFRDHGVVDTLAFYPQVSVLDDVWYGTDAKRLVPYLASFDVLVVRQEVMRSGFEEFGPLRQPISPEAYAKFDASPDLDRVYDDGELQAYRVALSPAAFSGGG